VFWHLPHLPRKHSLLGILELAQSRKQKVA
jgi:hypothetical protein